MDNNTITPQAVNQLTSLTPEEINQASEQVMEATQLGNRTIEELTHLSRCLSDFSETQEKYNKTSKHVRDQMRYISNHL